MQVVYNEKELQQALEKNIEDIGMEGQIVAKIAPLVGANNTAWCIAMVAITTAFIDSTETVGLGAAVPQSIMAKKDVAGAVDVLGTEATYAAIAIALAAGSIEILEHLRTYRLERRGDNRAILVKR
ncbi:hypothetical protein NHP190012_10660 [Helicobacter sp. NHP19-012]|uniref:Uncharacterized protein n=1 Tax=Helicobacter gastrofelis TaxID=2849642 RepID=A0ABM7SG90_9HELI|nr:MULTISPECIES: hypothetical protein [unclassified Helicobacter]BCZ19424.1 hypothetical protein NHP190012_10660 [Helicobacter sp. NHP19-012]GMB96415.1 hypothetical protein NHP22001_10040 [Helicobacter sp. NHP22-001]